MASSPEPTDILTLHIELQEIESAIWRRLQVRADISLAKLHAAIQIAFGWTNSHLHSFRFSAGEYANADDNLGEPEELRILPERRRTVAGVLGEDEGTFRHLYD